MLIHLSMFRDFPERNNILIVLFRSQRSLKNCVRGRQQPMIRMIAVNIYLPSHVDDGYIRHICSSHSSFFFISPFLARLCEDSLNNLHVIRNTILELAASKYQHFIEEKQKRKKVHKHRKKEKQYFISNARNIVISFNFIQYSVYIKFTQIKKYFNIATLYKVK